MMLPIHDAGQRSWHCYNSVTLIIRKTFATKNTVNHILQFAQRRPFISHCEPLYSEITWINIFLYYYSTLLILLHFPMYIALLSIIRIMHPTPLQSVHRFYIVHQHLFTEKFIKTCFLSSSSQHHIGLGYYVDLLALNNADVMRFYSLLSVFHLFTSSNAIRRLANRCHVLFSNCKWIFCSVRWHLVQKRFLWSEVSSNQIYLLF